LRGEEVHRAPAAAELLEQLGLADAAPAEEHVELGFLRVGELLEDAQLSLAADEHAAERITARIIRASILDRTRARAGRQEPPDPRALRTGQR
jgi:hypothetical protein